MDWKENWKMWVASFVFIFSFFQVIRLALNQSRFDQPYIVKVEKITAKVQETCRADPNCMDVETF